MIPRLLTRYSDWIGEPKTMETLIVFCFLNLMVCLGYRKDEINGLHIINGQGHKDKFRERKPVLLTIENHLIKEVINGPQLINGQGNKEKFLERKPVLLTIPKTINPEPGEHTLIKDVINGPQLINGQGHKVKFRKRKPELVGIPKIIHPKSGGYNFMTEDEQFLRRNRLPKVIHSLYYFETDWYSRVVYSKWLYSLRDVAKLFIERFDIDVIYKS